LLHDFSCGLGDEEKRLVESVVGIVICFGMISKRLGTEIAAAILMMLKNKKRCPGAALQEVNIPWYSFPVPVSPAPGKLRKV